MNKAVIVFIILVSIAAGWLFISKLSQADLGGKPESVTTPGLVNENVQDELVTVVAQNLNIPWSIAILPDGDMLVTERPGNIKRVSLEGEAVNVATIDEVAHRGEGGLLGIVLHPDFAENDQLFVYYTYSEQGSNTLNRVVRYELNNSTLSNREVIVNEIPGASNHNGGRMRFGPDGYLYITTGDAADPSLSQNKDSLAGKILRVTDDGSPASENPFDSPIYSYGHRNPQGIDWVNGQLWSNEHGATAQDELNRVERGVNYGWPTIRGEQTGSGMEAPVVQSGRATWAPGGLAHKDGLLYFTGLRGGALYVFDPANPQGGVKEYFKNEYGRLREIIVGPDGMLYITTSNRDGRGDVREGDDKILRVNPDLL